MNSLGKPIVRVCKASPPLPTFPPLCHPPRVWLYTFFLPRPTFSSWKFAFAVRAFFPPRQIFPLESISQHPIVDLFKPPPQMFRIPPPTQESTPPPPDLSPFNVRFSTVFKFSFFPFLSPAAFPPKPPSLEGPYKAPMFFLLSWIAVFCVKCPFFSPVWL